MSKPEIPDKVIDRIRKLLNMAADVSSPQEAAIAARRAEALMRQHNVESAASILEDLKKPKDNIVGQTVRANIWRKFSRSVPQWSQFIAKACADLFDCHVVKTMNLELGWHITFLGYKTDVEVCAWTFSYLLANIKRLSEKRVTFSRSAATAYHDGVTEAILINLAEAKRLKDLADRGNSTSTALVVRKREAIEEQFGGINYKESKGRKHSDHMAYVRGRLDGDEIAVNPNAVEGPQAPQTPSLPLR